MDMNEFATRICMPNAWPGLYDPADKPAITAEDTNGLYQYNYTGSGGWKFECWLEYDGYTEEIELIYALHKDEDISEDLSEDVRDTIEKMAMRKIRSEERNRHYDLAAAKAEAMKDDL